MNNGGLEGGESTKEIMINRYAEEGSERTENERYKKIVKKRKTKTVACM